MTASGAKQISDTANTALANANLNSIIAQIANLANQGYVQVTYYSVDNPSYSGAGPYMSASVQAGLTNLGYTLSTYTDPAGWYQTTVVW